MRIDLFFYLCLTCCLFSCSPDESEKNKGNKKSDITDSSKLFQKLSSEQSNIQFVNEIIEDHEVNIIKYDYLYNGGGVGVLDVNNDGFMDLYFTGNQSDDALYLNKGNLSFEDISSSSGIQKSSGWSCGVSIVDINKDGYDDIYISRSGPGDEADRRNALFINNKDNTFIESAKEYGLDYVGHSTQAVFCDFDKDGDKDLYLLTHPTNFGAAFELGVLMQMKESGQIESDRYFVNQNGKFVDKTNEAGVSDIAFGLGVMATDINNDGWVDLYVSNDYDEGDILYINDKSGGFRNDINKVVRHTSNYGMGCDFGDINNDGLKDLITLDMAFTSHERSKRNMAAMDKQKFYARVQIGWHYQYMHNMLHLNDGMGTFNEIAQLAGVSNSDWSWSALFGDYDNDGWQDIFVTNGYKRDTKDRDYKKKLEEKYSKASAVPIDDILNSIPQTKFSNFLYENKKDLTFVKANEYWGMEEEVNSNGCAHVDLDNDGDLDMVVSNMDAISVVYENLADSNGNSWLSLVHKESTNPTIELRSQGSKWIRDFQTVRGFQSSVDPRIHIGLGDVEKIDSLIVYWQDQTNLITNVSVNKILEISKNSGIKVDSKSLNVPPEPWFENAIGETKIVFKHEENLFDDYGVDVLLPHSMSQFGPHLSVNDLNKDGLADIFVGGAIGHSGRFFIQGKNGTFQRLKLQGIDDDDAYEDLGSLIFDCDKDGDNDLLVVSGGEGESSVPRLYQNNPTGINRVKNAFPENIKLSGMRAMYSDLNNNGNYEIWFGARWKAGEYLVTPESFIVEFENGRFVDVTNQICPEFKYCGMVTDLKTGDLNNDGLQDVVVVGEWMSPQVFINQNGKLINKTENWIPSNLEGWYFSCMLEDLNMDGKLDIVLGNLGRNNKFHPSIDKPLEAYAGDIDDNGTHDIVLAKYENNILYPVRGKECSTEQMPFISEKFKTFESYAKSDLMEIYGEEKLQELTHKTVYNFSSGILWNEGTDFNFEAFENHAQFGPIQDFLYFDVNQDGFKDIVYAGNMYNVEVETTRYDGSNGGVLINKGNGTYQFVDGSITGFNAPGDVRDLEYLVTGTGQKLVLISNNANYLFVYKLKE